MLITSRYAAGSPDFKDSESTLSTTFNDRDSTSPSTEAGVVTPPESATEAGVLTPPKTPARSPSPHRTPGRACAFPPLPSHCRVGETLGAALPWQVCEAVTAAVWSSAKASVAAEAGEARSARSKRRKLGPPVEFELSSNLNFEPASSSQSGAKYEHRVIFPATSLSQPSQPSQLSCASSQSTQTEETAARATAFQAMESLSAPVHTALRSSWENSGRRIEELPLDACRTIRKMEQAAQTYWRDSEVDLGKAASGVSRFLEHQRRLYWRKEPWRGVNLGGWLLLEPGPSDEIFKRYGSPTCEWEMMINLRSQLGDSGAEDVINEHRRTYFSEEDFRNIRDLGLNAVRIPFGYWIVVGPAEGAPYAGSGLEYIDRALEWCRKYGLQAVLDLHGAPGGESGERPCGHERKDWHWQEWRFDESVEALRVVAARYRGHPAVSGISVCNEPAESVPASALCHFYDRAVRAIREEGMAPDEVAIILPVFRTERLDEVWRLWSREFDGFACHANTAFDLHLYHVFGTWWQRQSLGNQLRMVKRHRKILRRVPAVVGEWSLALAPHATGDGPLEEDQAHRAFALAQLEAYSQASHGWFFWTWRDSPLSTPGWDLRQCLARSWLNKNELKDNCNVQKACASSGT